MTKWDIISITLTQLISQWNRAPEWRDQFELNEVSTGINSVSVSIKWDPRAKRYEPEQQQSHVPKTIEVSFQKTGFFSGLFTCTITDTSLTLPSQKNNKIMNSEHRQLASFTKLHKDFRRLQDEIIRYKRMKENNLFLEDLIKVFPRTLDGAILGDDYDE
jgi:hypothetical protein